MCTQCNNNNDTTMNDVRVTNAFQKPRLHEVRRRKVSSLGTIMLGKRFAGSAVLVRDNEDGTFTVFTR